MYLSKADALWLLFEVYEDIVIPRAVYREVVVIGFERGFRDAELVEAAVKEGSIRVEDVPREEVGRVLRLAPMLHRGEAETLALAMRYKPCHVLLDDRIARSVARVLGLEPHGTLYVVFTAAARNLITVSKALSILDELVKSGFRISLELYLKIRAELLGLDPSSGAVGDQATMIADLEEFGEEHVRK